MTAAEKQATGDSPSRYVDFDEFIDYQVKRTRSGIHHTELLAAGLVLALFTVTYLFAFVVLDQWVIPGGFGYGSRVIMLALVAGGAIGWTVWRIVLPYFRRINALYAAREIEAAYPDLQSTLLTWVDLKAAGRPVPPMILQAIEKRAALEMAHKDIDHAIDRRFLMRSAYALLAVLAVFCLYTIFSPKKISASIWRALLPTADVAVATTTSIVDVQPGDTEVLARSQVEVMAELAGVIPEEVTLLYTTADRRFVNEPIVMHRAEESLPRFHATLTGENGRGLLQDVRYRIVAGDARTREFRLRINQPPSATVTEVSYDYPEYMGLDDQNQPGGNIDAWEGTRVTVRALANMPVKSATILFSDTEDTSVRAEEIPMEVTDGVRLTASWQLAFRSDGTYPHFYRIQVKNERGETDPQPALKSVKIRPDLPPEIRLLHPTSDIEAPANGIIPIAYEALDPDFLLRRVVMKFEKQGEELPASPTLYEGPPFAAAVKSTYRLELERLNLKSGDKLSFYLRAEDNMEPFDDRIGNVRQTPKLNITIVDPVAPETVQEQLKAQENQIEQLRQADQPQNGEEPTRPPDQPPGEQTEHRLDEPNQSEDPTKPVRDDTQQTDGDPQNRREPMNGESNGEQPMQDGQPQQEGSTNNSGEQQGTNQNQGEAGGQPQSGEAGQQRNQEHQTGQQAPHSQAQRGASGGQRTSEQQAGHRQETGERPPGTPKDSAQTPSPDKSEPSGDASRPDKAPEDEALRELLKWAREHQQENPSTEQPNDDSQPGEKRDPAQEGQEGNSSDQNASGNQPNSNAQEESGKGANEQRAPGKEGSEGSESGAGEKNPSSPMPPGIDNRGQNPNGTGNTEPPAKDNDDSASPMPEENGPSQNGQGGQNPNGTGTPPSPSDPSASPSGPNGTQPPMPGAETPKTGERPTAKPPGESPTGNDSGNSSPMPQVADSSEKNGAKPGTPAAGDQPKSGPEKNRAENQSAARPGEANGQQGETAPKPAGEKSNGESAIEKVPGPEGEQKTPGESTRPSKDTDSAMPPDGGKPEQPSGTEQKPTQPNQAPQPNGQPKDPGQGAGQKPSSQSPDQGTDPAGAGGMPPQPPNGSGQSSPPSANPKPSAPGQGADPNAPQQPGEAGAGQGKEAMNRQNPEAGPSPSGTGTEGQNGKPQGTSGQGTSNRSAPDGQKNGAAGQPGAEKGGGNQGGSQEGGAKEPMSGKGQGAQQQDGAQGGQGNEPGAGDKGGGNKPGDAANGQGGQENSGGGKSGSDQGGKSGKGAAGEGGQAGQQAGAKPDRGQGQGSGGSPVGGGTGSPNAGGANSAGGSGGAGGEAAGAAPDEPDLANKKKATNLALQQLKDQLQRGETPRQLLDRLGYTQEDLDRFMRRLEQRLADPGIDDSPEAQAARRQFESLLKGIDYKSTGGVRDGGDGPREAASGFGAGNRPTPPEYRAAEQAYKKKLSETER